MANTTLGTRDELGDWRPPYLLEAPAPLAWPPRPLALLKWVFGFPGYLWPWSVFFFLFGRRPNRDRRRLKTHDNRRTKVSIFRVVIWWLMCGYR